MKPSILFAAMLALAGCAHKPAPLWSAASFDVCEKSCAATGAFKWYPDKAGVNMVCECVKAPLPE
jgi:hypothetical protein